MRKSKKSQKTYNHLSRRGFLFIILFLFTAISHEYIYAGVLTWGKKSAAFDIFEKKGIKIITDKNGFQTIEMSRKSYELSEMQRYNALYVSFDKTHEGAFPEKYINIVGGSLLKSNFNSVEFSDSVKEAASFEQPQHEVWISPAEYIFLNSEEDLENFSIAFMIRPYQLKRNMELMKKVALFGGKKQGIRAAWENDRLVFKFINFFRKDGIPVPEINIFTQDTIKINSFQRVILQYHENRGVLILYLNGIEQNRIYVTDNFSPSGTILRPSFHPWDKSPLIIGRNFLGAIDELIFANYILSIDNDTGTYGMLKRNGRQFIQTPSTAISKIIELPYSASEILNVNFEGSEERDTRILSYIRFSNRPFPENLSEKEFPFENTENINLREQKAKYIQWKVEFYSDSSGIKTPELNQVKISYRENPPPNAPRGLMAEETKEESVKLHFLRNAEMDVIKGGRYHIYYGIKPYEPLGIIRYKDFIKNNENNYEGVTISDNDKWETEDLRYQNRIIIEITNDMILKNFHYTKKIPKLRMEYPLLQKNIPYYFWITSCDSDWTEDIEFADHESKPSNVVTARPR